MHRTICRALRSICKTTSPPTNSKSPSQIPNSEDPKKSTESNNSPPPLRHTWTEAISWTTGLLLSYEYIHHNRRCQHNAICPFRPTTFAWSQPPLLSTTASHVFAPRKSIDVTPFILDRVRDVQLDDDATCHQPISEEEEEFVKFDESHVTRPTDSNAAQAAEGLTADILSVIGAWRMLNASGQSSTANGVEILERGAELGSRRCLYNLGVAYDRLNETEIAQSYYERAAELGHPLAAYNVAVRLRLKGAEGLGGDGRRLIEFAAEAGVKEAIALRADLGWK